MRNRQSGFSLLEAVVALTILATSGLALSSWFSLSMEGVFRLEELRERHVMLRNLQEYFTTLRLEAETQKTLNLDEYEVAWSSKLVEPIQIGRGMSGEISNFDLGLFDIEITIKREGKIVGQYNTRRAGYSKERGFSDAL